MSFLGSVLNVVTKVAGPFLGLENKMKQSAIACLAHVKEHAEQGNPNSVVAAIDEFAAKNMMMNVGEEKGAIVDAQICAKKPLVMVELGAYSGYSAVRFASLQRDVAGPDSHYFSFEYSPELAAIVTEMVAFAGLTNQVTVIVGAFAEKWDAIKEKHVDIFFLDHEKSCYEPDAKLIVGSNMLHKGSLLIADNVIFPGTPEYLSLLNEHPKFTNTMHEANTTTSMVSVKDAISVAEYQG